MSLLEQLKESKLVLGKHKRKWPSGPPAVLLTLLLGTLSRASPLYLLRGGLRRIILPMIWEPVKQYCLESVQAGAFSYNYTVPAAGTTSWFLLLGSVVFPPSQGINVNMMPFMWSDKQSLPQELQAYWPMIRQCAAKQEMDTSGIAYLTVMESDVEAGECQRRPGLHTESPGVLRASGSLSKIFVPSSPSSSEQYYSRWGGGGSYEDRQQGGLYMASSTSASCRVYNQRVQPGRQGALGDCEHLRFAMDANPAGSVLLHAGSLVWLTDSTLHEAVPLKSSCHRQFFRLVTSVSHLHLQHSTRNPRGVLPPVDVILLTENKFHP